MPLNTKQTNNDIIKTVASVAARAADLRSSCRGFVFNGRLTWKMRVARVQVMFDISGEAIREENLSREILNVVGA